MNAVVIDIETVGEPLSAVDELTKNHLIERTHREAGYGVAGAAAATPEQEQLLQDKLEKEMGLSPLTGEIVAIGVLDVQTNLSTVWYQAPLEQVDHPVNTAEVTYLATTELEMLTAFWHKMKEYNTVVTFNGWQFDLPFLSIRSAIHRIKPSLNLMSNRFLTNQRNGTYHIDLQDQLTYYNAVRRKGSLHMWCRAFGIASPKTDDVAADDVAGLFYGRQYKAIAEYNFRDIVATKQLFDYWDAYLNLGR